MKFACSGWLFVVLALLCGCDDTPKTRRPPSPVEGETVDDLRNRRRQGDTANSELPAPPFDSSFDRTDIGQPGRQETLRPDNTNQAARAAEDAEDLRDAAADRPRKPRGE